MKANEIADKAVELVSSGEYGFGLINIANADMVGHCGIMEPAIAAIETVDAAVGRIIYAVITMGGAALITADHGNAEEMMVFDKHGETEACTKHSTNPVPCILVDADYDGSYSLRQPEENQDPQHQPGLAHLAATLFEAMGEPVPDDLYPSLIQHV